MKYIYTTQSLTKWSWNPITGCLYNCKYCSARDMAMRVSGHFRPEFHEDRLNAPFKTKVPEGREHEPGIRHVFLGSMTDLFGEFIPDEWIKRVFDVVRRVPQWNFLCLTKNPERYLEISAFPRNLWIGATADIQPRMDRALNVFSQLKDDGRKPPITFVSCKPLSEAITMNPEHGGSLDWLIIGARSKTTKMPAFQPQRAWVELLLSQARDAGIAVYCKPNLTISLSEHPKEYPVIRNGRRQAQ